MEKYERETIINYNEEEKFADVYTYNVALQNRLDKFCAQSDECKLLSEGDGVKTYKLPKKWIKIQMPRQLSEETRQKLKDRAKQNFARQ